MSLYILDVLRPSLHNNEPYKEYIQRASFRLIKKLKLGSSDADLGQEK